MDLDLGGGVRAGDTEKVEEMIRELKKSYEGGLEQFSADVERRGRGRSYEQRYNPWYRMDSSLRCATFRMTILSFLRWARTGGTNTYEAGPSTTSGAGTPDFAQDDKRRVGEKLRCAAFRMTIILSRPSSKMLRLARLHLAVIYSAGASL
jgi:hypothetical protein